uniref:F-box domain-containing protein n=1 Tax=Oryza glumipatula TaxID=40148 RepID=A0A0E0AT28_9ORYZ
MRRLLHQLLFLPLAVVPREVLTKMLDEVDKAWSSTMARRMSRWRRFTSDEWRWLDFFKGLPCMHVFRVREVHAIGMGLTGEGEIEDGARRPVVEDDADLQDHCAIGWGTWGYMERGRHEADGVVVWLATVHCSQNDNDVKAATRRARSKAGDDTWRSRRSATREDGIKRKIFGMIRFEGDEEVEGFLSRFTVGRRRGRIAGVHLQRRRRTTAWPRRSSVAAQ